MPGKERAAYRIGAVPNSLCERLIDAVPEETRLDPRDFSYVIGACRLSESRPWMLSMIPRELHYSTHPAVRSGTVGPDHTPLALGIN